MQERGRRIHVVNLRKSGKFPSLCTTLEIFERGHVVLQKNVKKLRGRDSVYGLVWSPVTQDQLIHR